jgi:hypothetical protein
VGKFSAEMDALDEVGGVVGGGGLLYIEVHWVGNFIAEMDALEEWV